MKTSTLIIVILIPFYYINAQFSAEHIISTDEDWAIFVDSADLDGDGDMDVLCAASIGDSISWYENLDGSGTFGSQRIISNSTDGAYALFATDIDNDGDMDVISASSQDYKVAWYENLDGLGNFGTQQIISQDDNSTQVLSVYYADLDGDGDNDVLSANAFGVSNIAWYENLDGQGNFGDQHVINSSSEDGERSVFAADLDQDGDLDVLSTSYIVDKIVWYENLDGLGNFGSQEIISTDVIDPGIVKTGDLDGDGDNDVLVTSHNLNKVLWFENTNGLGSFSIEHTISTNVDSPGNAYPSDIDNDGDLDVLSTSLLDDKIAWYENLDGLGNFGVQQIITTNTDQPASIVTADLDGDGDLDVVSASSRDNKIAWFENESALSVDELKTSNLFFYPNPVDDIITIESKSRIFKIEIYNYEGQKVLYNLDKNTIDLSSLPSAVYILKAYSSNRTFDFYKVVKK